MHIEIGNGPYANQSGGLIPNDSSIPGGPLIFLFLNIVNHAVAIACEGSMYGIISKNPKYFLPKILVLVTKDAKIKPNVNAINVAKKDTVIELTKGVQKIFLLIDDVNTLSIYLYVNSPSLLPESIASIIVKDTEFEKIETIGAITR